ncbi:double zinc ribbon domain-containing protein [Porticoccus sp. W117]|uniref:ComF family protein n=1 Tax=Porticoccus sp. W117 TaxID=3054777 RepID=UPI002595F267|nr:double zinc ribbon domain-containing protein [Porticoccus sp. W117]MDM3870709.1 double zinc ribbon domain-containing protein [Porticoccus sp. W117]
MFGLHQVLQTLRRTTPNRCLLCQYPVTSALPLCHPCQLELPWLNTHCQHCSLPLGTQGICGECLHSPPPWRQCIAAFEYTAPVKQLIIQYKQSANLAAGRTLAHLLAKAVQLNAEPPLPQLLLPVPMHWRGQLARGFNQSYDLARMLSTQLGIAASCRHLRKRHHTQTQHTLPRKQRQRNLHGQFEIRKSVSGKRIALIDDVMTTGSTARAIAGLLVKEGAEQVDIWCVARTPKI